ncbi:unnamed protein product, partial [Rotaria sp. Silwood2]
YLKFSNEHMDQVKRQFTFSQSPEQAKKKLRNDCDRSITCIENLANEFFYEIFDYLSGYEIYKGFSNLNHCFQRLLNSSSLLFEIKLTNATHDETLTNNYRQFLCRVWGVGVWFE